MDASLIVLLASVDVLAELVEQVDGDVMDDADVLAGVGFRGDGLFVLLDALDDLVQVAALTHLLLI